MSEYWVSHKRYFCKYCNIYIADDAPSRRQHETGLKHKGNVERFVRGLYKAGEKRKHDLEEEKREMARIERAANAAFEQDVGAGHARGVASSSSSSSAVPAAATSKPAAPKPSNPFANYSTAESLGYTDPDAERAKAEAERRRTMGVAGEWEIVDAGPSSSSAPPQAEGEAAVKAEEGAPPDGAQAGEKRPAEEEQEDGRAWKLRRKTANVGLGELYDPGALPIKLKTKVKVDDPAGAEALETTLGVPAPLSGSEKPAWKPKGWNKPGEYSTNRQAEDEAKQEAEESMGAQAEGVGENRVSKESVEPQGPRGPPEPEVKAEEVKPEPLEPAAPPPPTGGSLFKKRKAPVGGGSRGGRRI